MSSVRVNIYYNTKDILVDSFDFDTNDGKITSIDEARSRIISHLDKQYSDTKYKLNLYNSFNGQSEINLFFENNLVLLREIRLKNILKDD
jgi:hypothetical protein